MSVDAFGVGTRSFGVSKALSGQYSILPATILDFAVIVGAGVVVSLAEGRGWSNHLQLSTATFACFAALVVLLRHFGVFAPNHSYRQIFTVVLSAALAFVVTTAVARAGGLPIARDVSASITVTGLAGLSIWRLVLKARFASLVEDAALRNRRMVVIGRSDRVSAAASRIIVSGERVDALLAYDSGDNIHAIERLARRAAELASAGDVDAILISADWRDAGALEAMVDALRDSRAHIRIVNERGVFPVRFAETPENSPIAIGDYRNGALSRSQIVAKRTFDLFAASLGLVALAPLFLATALAIRLTSRGPALFRQTRDGIGGKPFQIYKFRTMTVLEDGDAVRQATRGDVRVTAVGRLLRRTSIDELPQLWNVLKGDMSIVGPRPHASAVNDDYRPQIAGYSLRQYMKPGLTGWAQVNGWRGTMTLDSMKSRIAHDLHYIDHWSVLLDLYIVLLTLKLPFRDRAAF